MRILAIIFVIFSIIRALGPSSDDIPKTQTPGSFDPKATKILYDKGAYEEAEKMIDDFLMGHPKDAIALAEKAYVKIANNDNEEGIIILNELLNQDPYNDSNLNNLSWAYNNLNLGILALDYANKALEIQPNSEYEYTNKGNALISLGRYDEAQASYEKAIELNNTMPFAYYGKGMCLYNSSDFKNALDAFESAFRINPEDASYLEYLVYCSKELKAYDKIVDACDKLLSIDKRNVDANFYMGQALYNLHRHEDAIIYFDKAAELSDYDAIINFEKCKAYLKVNNKAAAYACLEKAYQEDEQFTKYVDLEEINELKDYKDFNKLFYL